MGYRKWLPPAWLTLAVALYLARDTCEWRDGGCRWWAERHAAIDRSRRARAGAAVDSAAAAADCRPWRGPVSGGATAARRHRRPGSPPDRPDAHAAEAL